jgi:putative nucleotidyltransferase with HDIG domain
VNLSVRLLIIATTAAAIIAIAAAVLLFRIHPEVGGWWGIAFWVALTLLGAAMPVRLPQGTVVSVSGAPVLASMVLGGPVAAAIVTGLGTTDPREASGKVPWYGTLFNHAALVLAVIIASVAFEGISGLTATTDPWLHGLGKFFALICAAGVFFVLSWALAVMAVRARTGASTRQIWVQDFSGVSLGFLGLAPLAWLMAEIFQLPNGVGWWATPLFVVPLFTTRLAYHRYVETRELFEQTIGALAKAVDARDRYTRGHSGRVSTIAEAMCRVMRLQEAEIEVIKWAGLLHDVGKIGVRDNVLLKEGPLDREERILMNQHPVIGAEIVQPASQLAPESPLIRAHHEWFNGSGYPDGLEALDIPLGARILGVADSYEAMTSARPYRKVPLTHEQAIGELRKYSGIQFDPEIVPVLIGLDRETLDRRSDREDELPTMLHQSDPRDPPAGGTGTGPGTGTNTDTDADAQGRDKPETLPAPRAAIVGQAEPRTEPRNKQPSRPALADDVS